MNVNMYIHLQFTISKNSNSFFPCAIASVAADFGRSDGLVHHVEVQCSGTEMALSECLGDGESGSGLSLVPVNTDPEYCSNHAGVICEGK